MNILVAYATRHGATRDIATRIAARLRLAGHYAEEEQVADVGDLASFDAFVIGSAAYMTHWQHDAIEFVRRNSDVLADHPVWLFSSGPLGTSPVDAQGRDQRAAAEPKEIPEFRDLVRPVDHRVFFGALDPSSLGFRDRAIRTLPAGRALLPDGDFRDWQDIEDWADGIAGELEPVGAAGR